MLPIILYNNMEGGSNSLNNTPNSSFSHLFDDTTILNSVRNRKKVSELANCPTCSCTIRQGELESHLALELERLNKLSSGTKRKLSSTSSNSNLAIPGSSAEENVEDNEIDVSGCTGSDVYSRVHGNRLRRLRARRRGTPPPSEGECPVCNTKLPMSRLQRHALRCLKRTGAAIDEDVPDTSSEEGSIDVENDLEGSGSFGAEYMWCGEWRVRANALQQHARGNAAANTEDDLALIVVDDEDTELYGPPQYSPSSIAPDAEISQPEEPQQEMSERNIHSDVVNENGIDRNVKSNKANGLVEASAETRIQALKLRIRELEKKQNSATEAKCLICLGQYTSPAVSIQCWHVYCEVCWLQSLKSKKMCPQCNAITTSQHLRRIYM